MAKTLTLCTNGQTNWRIVLVLNASASERYAAEELQHFLQEISGAHFPIVEDRDEFGGQEIILGGLNSRLAKLGQEIDLPRLGAEGFVIRTTENALIIAGGQARGTLYGVYTFLEDYLGCRWFTPEVSHIPTRDTITIGEIEKEFIPALETREMVTYTTFNGDWAARNKMNGSHHRLFDRHGDKVRIAPTYVHSFESIIPVAEYFAEHPEYFSEIDGKRISERTQLCLTNPDVLRITIDTVKRWIRDNPKLDIVTVSQNDWYNPCQCENCRAIDEKEGSHAGTMLHFVNAVAEEIEKEFPHVAVDTLAYQYTRKAPRYVRPRANVIVRLCSIECCFSHPLGECHHVARRFRSHVYPDATFLNDLKEWSKISNRLYVWDYVTNFSHYLIPFPNLRVLKPNIQLFVRHNVKGVMEQGSYSVGSGEEFAELRSYVIAKLLWDPEYDDNRAIDEFLAGYYKSAGPFLRKYLDILHDKVRDENIHLGLYDHPAEVGYLTEDFLDMADELFDQAERVADDEDILRRVRKARLPIRYVRLVFMPLDAPGRLELIDEFFEDLRSEGITEIRERRPLMTSKKMMEAGELSPGRLTDFFIFG